VGGSGPRKTHRIYGPGSNSPLAVLCLRCGLASASLCAGRRGTSCDAAWQVPVCAQAAEEPPAMRSGKCQFVRRPPRNLLRCGLASASLCAGRRGTSCDAAWQVRVCAQAAEEPPAMRPGKCEFVRRPPRNLLFPVNQKKIEMRSDIEITNTTDRQLSFKVYTRDERVPKIIQGGSKK